MQCARHSVRMSDPLGPHRKPRSEKRCEHLALDTQCVSNMLPSPSMSKDAGMRIRVEKDLRDEFVQACREQDRPAADVLREFMRTFTLTQQSGQARLFADTKRTNVAD